MDFTVTILGSSSATPTRTRNMTAQFVQLSGTGILIDCAEGTQMRLLHQHIGHSKIDIILISHLHGDHYLGLLPLLGTMNLHGRKKPLYLYGPKGLDEIITVNFKHSHAHLQFPLHFRPTPQEADGLSLLHETPHFHIHTFSLVHRVPTNGFKIEERKWERKIVPSRLPEGMQPQDYQRLKEGKDIEVAGQKVLSVEVTDPPPKPRSYAFCSDTRFYPPLVASVKGVGLLYHEATFTKLHQDRAEKTQHSTAEEAATIARQAQVEKLLLGHFSTRYNQLDDLLQEAREVFAPSELAEEGATFEVPQAEVGE